MHAWSMSARTRSLAFSPLALAYSCARSGDTLPPSVGSITFRPFSSHSRSLTCLQRPRVPLVRRIALPVVRSAGQMRMWLCTWARSVCVAIT